MSKPAKPGRRPSAASNTPSRSSARKPAPLGRSARPGPSHAPSHTKGAAPAAPARKASPQGRPARPGTQASATGAKAAPTSRAKPAPARSKGPAPAGERLQKLLAHAGIASRRACEELILEGHVQVNGVTVTELGTRADPSRDEVTVDFVPIHREAPVYILMNKPKGYVTTVKDDEGRPTVMALLQGIPARVYPVGRLDFQSEGLLLMTNDGALAEKLTSPDSHIPKIYLVKVHREVPEPTLKELREGFRLDGRRLKPCGIEVAEKQDNPWLKVTLIEGKNQQIRRMFAAVGHPVSKLRRIQFGPLDDPYLKPGAWRFLTPQEVAALRAL